MKCKDVLDKFQKLVPFPMTPKKIKAAGYDVGQYLKSIGKELSKCEDVDEHPLAKSICDTLQKMLRMTNESQRN